MGNVSHEREQNAKKIYVPGVLDNCNSWIIFDDAQALNEKFTAQLLRRFELEFNPAEEVLGRFDKRYAHEYFNSRYRGAYLGRSFVRHAAQPGLPYKNKIDSAIDALSVLYPEDLSHNLETCANWNVSTICSLLYGMVFRRAYY